MEDRKGVKEMGWSLKMMHYWWNLETVEGLSGGPFVGFVFTFEEMGDAFIPPSMFSGNA